MTVNSVDRNSLNTNGEIETQYSISGRGTETIRIVDPMLNTTDAVKARAEGIFLEQSYKHTVIIITLPFIEGLNIGYIIELDSIKYKIIGISLNIVGAVRENTIKIKRWD